MSLALALGDEKLGRAPIWGSSFALARRLRTLSSDNPEQYEGAVAAFCEKAGHDPEHFWYGFLDSWDKVRTAEGDDVLAWAVAQADQSPYPLANCPGPSFGRLASIAWHLSRHTAPDPFFLPRERLAELLGLPHAMYVTRIIGMLEKRGLVQCVNEEYKFRGNDRSAKEYRFIGGQTPSTPPA